MNALSHGKLLNMATITVCDTRWPSLVNNNDTPRSCRWLKTHQSDWTKEHCWNLSIFYKKKKNLSAWHRLKSYCLRKAIWLWFFFYCTWHDVNSRKLMWNNEMLEKYVRDKNFKNFNQKYKNLLETCRKIFLKVFSYSRWKTMINNILRDKGKHLYWKYDIEMIWLTTPKLSLKWYTIIIQ